MKEGYLAFLGSRTEEVIRSYYVDKVFFPVRHLIRNGESWNPRSLLAQRKSHDRFRTQKILVVDSTKFDQTAFSVAGKLRDLDVVVTDKRPSEKWLARFTNAGIECRYPKQP